jgi:alkyl sulfatase BDS1-like metallo-beta-lactamase superfamily hydrolase
MNLTAKGAIDQIQEQNAATGDGLPFGDRRDFEDAQRGFLGALQSCVVRNADGRIVWDNDSYSFLEDDAPPATVNPSLWRQSQLVAKHGLYEVTEGIYQVRGLDLSNVTFVEGDVGVVVIDPLISTETAAAALALYREHRGDRPVTGVIYTHSHGDHFGGVKGVTSQEEVEAGRVVVAAPSGFVEHAIKENVYAGTAMGRRAGYMYGAALDRGPRGQVGAGLGQTTSTGTVTLIAPTLEISTTGQEEEIDGVRMVFQMAPGAEAPAEMHFYFPDHKALCMAENSTHTLHNLLTLRGALVRDPNAWAGYLTEAIDLFGDDVEVAFASHHWPTWGRERVTQWLTLQRDLYAYLHDQTLRLLNKGLVGAEIAEQLQLPPALENAWHARGYYGSVSHNVKAIYQRYMGWYDGNPAHLWGHPPVAAATRYVDYMGGAGAVVAKARDSFAMGDLRWVAEVLNHVVFAEPDHVEAKLLLADTYEQLGYGCENGTWRSVYLSGAYELRHGSFGTPVQSASADMVAQLPPEMLFDALAIRVDGPRAWDEKLTIDIRFTDTDEFHRLRLANGVLTHSPAEKADAAELTVSCPRGALPALALGQLGADDLAEAGVELHGDASALARLLAVLDSSDPDFAIVTPD